MTRNMLIALLGSVATCISLSVFAALPNDILFWVWVVLLVVLVLALGAALIYQCFHVTKEFTISNEIFQYALIATSSVYFGRSMAQSFSDSSLDVAGTFGSIFVTVFCIMTMTDTVTGAVAKRYSDPGAQQKEIFLRLKVTACGMFWSMLIPSLVGVAIFFLDNFLAQLFKS